MTRAYLTLALCAALLLATCIHARAEYDCAMVRAQVAQHGKIKAIAWALANGYTPSEISRIRKACRV